MLHVCHISSVSFVFKQKIYCSFFQMESIRHRTRRAKKLVIFCGRHKCMTPKWFKTTARSLEPVAYSSTSSHKPQTLWLRREQPQAPIIHPILCWWPKQSTWYFQLVLNFFCKKFFRQLNIVPWVASNKPLLTRKYYFLDFLSGTSVSPRIIFLLISVSWPPFKLGEFLLC